MRIITKGVIWRQKSPGCDMRDSSRLGHMTAPTWDMTHLLGLWRLAPALLAPDCSMRQAQIGGAIMSTPDKVVRFQAPWMAQEQARDEPSGQTRTGAMPGPGLGLSVLAIVLPALVVLSLFYRGAEGLLPGTVFSIALVGCGLAALALTRLRSVTPGMAVVTALAAVWLASGTAGAWQTAQAELLQLFGAAGVFIAAHTLARSGRLTDLTVKVLVFALLAYVAIALMAYGNDFARHPDDSSHRGTFRLRASFVSPNVAATLFGLCALIGLARLANRLYNPGPRIATRADLLTFILRHAFAAFGLAVLAVTALWLTASRAGIVLSFIALGALLAVELVALRHRRGRPRRLLKSWQWAVLGGLAMLAMWLVFSEVFGLRLAQIGNDAGDRMALYSIYWTTWQDAFWTGHGLGSFNRVNDAMMTPEAVPYLLPVGAAHNLVLQWLIQQGVIGTVLMFSVVLAIHVPLLRCLSGRYQGSLSLIWLAVCASGLVILHGMVDYGLELPGLVWLWSMLLGLAHGRCFILKRL